MSMVKPFRSTVGMGHCTPGLAPTGHGKWEIGSRSHGPVKVWKRWHMACVMPSLEPLGIASSSWAIGVWLPSMPRTSPFPTRMGKLPRSTGTMVPCIQDPGRTIMPGAGPSAIPMASLLDPASSKLACSDWVWWIKSISPLRTSGATSLRSSGAMGLFTPGPARTMICGRFEAAVQRPALHTETDFFRLESSASGMLMAGTC
mmetsp:Transcript_12054/g.20668  ORF Transcript_12054/g.20668 Transcript_12054/m.20668 type:complete len:202 (+) Transcript_12054:183-788(+)